MRISELGFCTGPGGGSCLRGQTSPLFTGAEAARLSSVQRGGTSSFGSSQFSQKNHPFPPAEGACDSGSDALADLPFTADSLSLVKVLICSAATPKRSALAQLDSSASACPVSCEACNRIFRSQTHLPHHGKAARPLQRGAGNT